MQEQFQPPPRATIRKALKILGKNLQFRNVTVSDIEFILSLRTDPGKSKHLSPVVADMAQQRDWLARYEKDPNQAYFIIESNQRPLGTVRLYDPVVGSFCWGSWILKDSVPNFTAIESALMVYAYAVDHLGFRSAHFDVRKANDRVWRFHERFGAKRVNESELDYFYQIDYSAISLARERFRRYLDDLLEVSYL